MEIREKERKRVKIKQIFIQISFCDNYFCRKEIYKIRYIQEDSDRMQNQHLNKSFMPEKQHT